MESGFYFYNNQLFDRKEGALDQALINRDDHPNITFWYNDDVYSKINWTIDPPYSLDQLYRIRAQQLRDQFEYLILLFSGGSDTNQILQTFLKYKIFIDEVQTYNPVQAIKLTPSLDRLDPLGIVHEFQLAALPRLQQIRKQSPKTKIKVIDIPFDQYDNDNFYNTYSEIFLYSSVWFHLARVRMQHEVIEDSMDYTGKKVGVIVGADKPNLLVKDGRMYSYFIDTGRSAFATIVRSKSYKDVPFYWSKDFPLISIKQAHVVKNALANFPPHLVEMFHTRYLQFRESHLMKYLIYPSFDPRIYQKIKKNQLDDDAIVYQIEGERAADALQQNFASITRKYQRVFNKDKGNDLLLIKSRLYDVGQFPEPS